MTEVSVPRELLPCPFCGGRARVGYIRDGQRAHCCNLKCGAAGPPQFHGHANQPSAHECAATAWNTRAHPTHDPSAVIAAARWQPIETAPKTPADTMIAVPVVAYCPDEHPNDRIRIIWWEPRIKGGCWSDDRDNPPVRPTHWMPLPEPPSTGDAP